MLQDFFNAVSVGIEGSKKEVRGKRQRNSPGGGSTGRVPEQSEPKDLSVSQIAEVGELIQGGMNGLAQVVGTKLQQHNERLGVVEASVSTQEKAISALQCKQTELERAMSALQIGVQQQQQEQQQPVNAVLTQF